MVLSFSGFFSFCYWPLFFAGFCYWLLSFFGGDQPGLMHDGHDGVFLKAVCCLLIAVLLLPSIAGSSAVAPVCCVPKFGSSALFGFGILVQFLQESLLFFLFFCFFNSSCLQLVSDYSKPGRWSS